MVTMRPIQFDPFGEPVAQASSEDKASTSSRVPLRLGVGLFWVMVVAIVAARVVYLDPAFAEKFGAVASLIGNLKAIVGA